MASPWLMLPPTIEPNQNKKAYNFYSIAQNKVITLSSEYDDKGFMIPDDEETLCLGSSHGWLALFYPSNLDLFLFNPLSRCHIKLPSVYTLPLRPENFENIGWWLKKLIISCSPHEEDCRALLSFDFPLKLAFCCPGSREAEAVWTTIGGDEGLESTEDYIDFVYSSTHKLFFCTMLYGDIEVLDLRNPSSPNYIIRKIDVYVDRPDVYPCVSPFSKKFLPGWPLWFLVPYNGDFFMVDQFSSRCVDPLDGSAIEEVDECVGNFPYKTLDFDVYRYDVENEESIYLNRETDKLNDLAFFVGVSNHSFALSAREFPELKPNSVYFTDSIIDWQFDGKPFGGHDVGIFNIKDQTFSSCYYPCDAQSIRKIKPRPVWFTPNPN